MLVIFVANLARPAAAEADALAPLLGLSPYDARLALAVVPPAVLLSSADPSRASEVLGVLRSRGHDAHIFDEVNLVTSEGMTRADDFVLEAEGMRRTQDGELLPYGDVFAILRAVHDSANELERQAKGGSKDRPVSQAQSLRLAPKKDERENVAYFFRRSGERPWLLREQHASYLGLGADRTPIAFANFTRTIARMRGASSMAIYDDRLARRHLVDRAGADGERNSRERMDLLAHLLAMTIASQGGSPYR